MLDTPSFYVDLTATEALHAECALFHDSSGPNGDIRVKLVTEAIRPIGFPVVEHPGAVGAVNRAISSTYASVVDLDVQSLIVVISGVDRTNRFTGRIFTVLAQDWDELGFDFGKFAFPIPFNTYPFVGTALLEIIFGVNRNVVLSVTRNNAGLATGTTVQVYYHSPFVIYPISYH